MNNSQDVGVVTGKSVALLHAIALDMPLPVTGIVLGIICFGWYSAKNNNMIITILLFDVVVAIVSDFLLAGTNKAFYFLLQTTTYCCAMGNVYARDGLFLIQKSLLLRPNPNRLP